MDDNYAYLCGMTEDKIRQNFADEIETDVESFKNYEPENSNILPIIYQSGYLTIKNYDEESELYTLGIPNREVQNGLYKILIPKFSKQH